MLFDNKTMTVELRSIKTGERFVKSTGDVCISTCDCSIPMMVVLSKPHNLSWALREMFAHPMKSYIRTTGTLAYRYNDTEGEFEERLNGGEWNKMWIDRWDYIGSDWRPADPETTVPASPDDDSPSDLTSVVIPKPHDLSWALREMRVHEGKWYTHQNACGQFANVDGVIMYRPYNGEPRKAVIDYSLIRSTDWRPVETEPAIKAAPDMDAVRDKLSQLCRVLGVEVVRTVEVQP